MKYLMIGIVKLYRKFISPIKPPCCRFTPTCSAYAIEAFSKRGFIVGFILTVWRILRCNPFCRGGFDPVPERGLRRSKKFDPKRCESIEISALPRVSEDNIGQAIRDSASTHDCSPFDIKEAVDTPKDLSD